MIAMRNPKTILKYHKWIHSQAQLQRFSAHVFSHHVCPEFAIFDFLKTSKFVTVGGPVASGLYQSLLSPARSMDMHLTNKNLHNCSLAQFPNISMLIKKSELFYQVILECPSPPGLSIYIYLVEWLGKRLQKTCPWKQSLLIKKREGGGEGNLHLYTHWMFPLMI